MSATSFCQVRNRNRSHRGVVLVAMLVCLLVVMLISGALVRGLVVQRRLARAEPNKLQAFWIAESAVQRAIARLESSADYEGETWEIQLTRDGSELKSTAVIRIEAIEGQPNRQAIVVEARSPDDPLNGVLEQRRIVVNLVTEGES